MGFFANLISLSSFVSGTVFGVLICVGLVLQFLKKSEGTDDQSKERVRYRSELAMPNPPKSIDALVTPEDAAALKKLINFLEDFNAPLKSIGGYLKQIYIQRDTGIKATKELLERKQKVIIEIGTVSRMEKEFYDNLAHLKEHTKTLKGVTSFLTELSKAFAGFSKDLNRLSNTAKNNMYKGLKDLNIDTKEDMIVNNWWQALHVSLDYMSSDQDYLALQISDELLNFSVQIHDELTVIEKRLNAEGTKQLHNIKEALSLYESKRRERDKYREKVRLQGNSATLTTQSPAEIAQRRALKMKINDDQLSLQTTKLYVVQKEFFNLMPRIDADVQLTILKSIVETHSQLLKLTEALERQQESNRMISKRMKLQLTNAAASLMQMIRDEGNLLTPSAASEAALAAGMGGALLGASVSGGTAAGEQAGGGTNDSISVEPEILAYEEALRAKMLESGVQGYELSLQRVLEGLLQHCQAFDFTYGLAQSPQGQLQSMQLQQQQQTTNTTTNNTITTNINNPNTNPNTTATNTTTTNTTTPATDAESRGELNMYKESTACLAATNPSILPLLPSRFGTAVGTETCVWFNAFSGRVYRDISHSNYFYNWFCAKLTHMLNKGPRPDYVDEFKVNDVQFGVLPPLLMNVQWAPPCKPGPFSFQRGEEERSSGNNNSGGGSGKKNPPSPSQQGGGRSSSTSNSNNNSNSTNNTSTGGGKAGPSVTSPNRAFIYDESDSEGSGDSDHDTTNNNTNTSSKPRSSGNTTTSNTTSTGNSSNTGSSSSKGKYKAPSPKADDSEFFAACTADMAFRSGIKFTISTKLWINWPRDRYASVPVILYLNLEELSGRIRFGVTRSHSFFSFLGDPLMRINVRNEVGKGAYKFKDFPQLSEFITKKLRAYVHNKIVHPHSHKFRLIWPRNWWPEGTQNEFMGDGEEQAKGAKYAAPPAAPSLQQPTTQAQGSVGVGGGGVPGTPHATPVVGAASGSVGGGTTSAPSSLSVPPTPEPTPYSHTPHTAAYSDNASSSNTSNTNTGLDSEQTSGRSRANSRGSGTIGALATAATAGVQALSQAGATASHKVEELAEKLKAAGESAGIAAAGSSSGGGAAGSASSAAGGAAESGAGSSSSSSSSRYSAMRSKVSQWMHSSSSASRRASTGMGMGVMGTGGSGASDDHYHPMSRAGQQQNSPHPSAKSTKSPAQPRSQTSSPVPSQKAQLSPNNTNTNSSGGHSGGASPSPRRRGSDTMQAVMASARQSELFHSPAASLSPASAVSAASLAKSSQSAPAAAAPAATTPGGSGGVIRLRSPTIYDADGEDGTEGDGNGDGVGEGDHHDLHDDDGQHLFDAQALLALTPLQQEVLKDNLAWDLEVKNIVNRYVHSHSHSNSRDRALAQTGAQAQRPRVYSPFSTKSTKTSDTRDAEADAAERDDGEGEPESEPQSGSEEGISPSVYRAAMRGLLAAYPAPRRRSASNLDGVPYHHHNYNNTNDTNNTSGMSIRTGGFGVAIDKYDSKFDQFNRLDSSHSLSPSSAHSTPHVMLSPATPAHSHPSLSSPEQTRQREFRSKSILSTTSAGTGTGTGAFGENSTDHLPRCRSFEAAESSGRWAHGAGVGAEVDADEADGAPRARSYSISDFRPETQDAMFRIHILDAYLHLEALRRGNSTSHSDGSGTGTGDSLRQDQSQGVDQSHADAESSTSKVSSNTTSIAPTGGRGRAHSVTGRTDDIAASASSHDVRSAAAESAYPRRALPRPQSAYLSRAPASSLQSRLSVASGTASADIASKFADFKAKHLNNRDLSQVFMRRLHNTSGKLDADESEPDRDHDHEQDVDQEQEYAQHSLTSMREALDAEGDLSDSRGDSSRDTRDARASLSGSGSGTGAGASSTLKYMSSMFRSKFGSSESGSDRKGGST